MGKHCRNILYDEFEEHLSSLIKNRKRHESNYSKTPSVSGYIVAICERAVMFHAFFVYYYKF